MDQLTPRAARVIVALLFVPVIAATFFADGFVERRYARGFGAAVAFLVMVSPLGRRMRG